MHEIDPQYNKCKYIVQVYCTQFTLFVAVSCNLFSCWYSIVWHSKNLRMCSSSSCMLLFNSKPVMWLRLVYDHISISQLIHTPLLYIFKVLCGYGILFYIPIYCMFHFHEPRQGNFIFKKRSLQKFNITVSALNFLTAQDIVLLFSSVANHDQLELSILSR